MSLQYVLQELRRYFHVLTGLLSLSITFLPYTKAPKALLHPTPLIKETNKQQVAKTSVSHHHIHTLDR